MLVEKQNRGYVELTLGYLFIFILVVCISGCAFNLELKTPIGDPPNVKGYKAIEFGQPCAGELMWVGGNAVITNYGERLQGWILEKE